MSEYRLLQEGEIIQDGDEVHNDITWERVRNTIGKKAPNPLRAAHRIYRRRVDAGMISLVRGAAREIGA